jgi:peptidyl-prolyl cis-trans isomerase B (cyclophilin B)
MLSFFKNKPLILVMMALLVGCSSATPKNKNVSTTISETKGIINYGIENKMSDKSKVVVETNKGKIELELFTEKAPITTANFTKLVESNFYNGLTFHRYVPGFVIQGGDPKGNGTGGSSEKIKLEIHPDLKHGVGALAMARSQHPDSASSQFYITLAPQAMLDGQYAVFGKVTSGMDVVQSLREGDKMNKISIS